MARRDEREYAEFVRASQQRLRATAYLLCGDWGHASDIVQEALIRVYTAWPRLESRGGAHAYARRCVATVAIDRSRRRSSTERPLREGLVDTGSVPDPAGALAERQALLSALRGLGPRQRACVVLRFFEDLSVQETARALGCSEGTVKSQTARALATLRTLVDIDDDLLPEETTQGALP